MRILVRKTIQSDIDFVINNVRNADKIEIESATGLNYERVLNDIYDIKDNHSFTGLVDENIVVIFGIRDVSLYSKDGIPWMISTKNIDKYRITFLRHCKQVFKLISCKYEKLYNFVDDRNKLAKIWLKWLGFKLFEPTPYGYQKLPFRFFNMEVKNV